MNNRRFAVMLANENAWVIVAEYNNDGYKKYSVRRVIGHFSTSQDKVTFYGVELDSPIVDGTDLRKPLNHGVTSIGSRYILAYNTANCLNLTKLRNDLMMERERKLFDIDVLNTSYSEAVQKLVLMDL